MKVAALCSGVAAEIPKARKQKKLRNFEKKFNIFSPHRISHQYVRRSASPVREVWYTVTRAAGFANVSRSHSHDGNLKKEVYVLKKFICSALSVVLAACCLTACSKPDETGKISEGDPTSSVTDFVVGEVENHEPILPWQFEEGEEVENPYYKRTTDENGTNVYAVLKASDNQVACLPMSNTVVYMGNSDADCFFERTTNTYKLDGEDQTVVQFQLYVADTAPETPSIAAPELDGVVSEDQESGEGEIARDPGLDLNEGVSETPEENTSDGNPVEP